MNPFWIGVAEVFGLLGKTKKFLKGKKTILSATGGMLASGAAVVTITITWVDGGIDAGQYFEQVTIPATAFWASVTFLWSAMHTKNVIEKEKEKLGPGG